MSRNFFSTDALSELACAGSGAVVVSAAGGPGAGAGGGTGGRSCAMRSRSAITRTKRMERVGMPFERWRTVSAM